MISISNYLNARRFRTGYVPDPPDHRDRAFRALQVAAIQQTYSLALYARPYKQNSSDCVVNGGLGALAAGVRATGRVAPELSRRHAYYAARAFTGPDWTRRDAGTFVRDFCKSTVKYGCPLERDWNYGNHVNQQPPFHVTVGGRRHKTLGSYERMAGDNLLELCQLALLSGALPMLGTAIGANWYAHDGERPLVPPRSSSDIVGYHAVYLTGWGITTIGIPYVQFCNSWGTNWGLAGFGRMALSYLDDPTTRDIWVVRPRVTTA